MLATLLTLSLCMHPIAYEEDTVIASDDIYEYITPGAIIYLPTEVQEIIAFKPSYDSSKPHLTKSAGVFYGPSGKETWYNMNMNTCLDIMRSYGYDYEYWIRDDGVKMYGDYVMIAANVYVYPKGTILETSLGTAIVVDHCPAGNIDICVTWKRG